MSSFFENVEGAAPIEIFLLNKLYKEDTFAQKIDLGIGAYRTNEGKRFFELLSMRFRILKINLILH